MRIKVYDEVMLPFQDFRFDLFKLRYCQIIPTHSKFNLGRVYGP